MLLPWRWWCGGTHIVHRLPRSYSLWDFINAVSWNYDSGWLGDCLLRCWGQPLTIVVVVGRLPPNDISHLFTLLNSLPVRLRTRFLSTVPACIDSCHVYKSFNLFSNTAEPNRLWAHLFNCCDMASPILRFFLSRLTSTEYQSHAIVTLSHSILYTPWNHWMEFARKPKKYLPHRPLHLDNPHPKHQPPSNISNIYIHTRWFPKRTCNIFHHSIHKKEHVVYTYRTLQNTFTIHIHTHWPTHHGAMHIFGTITGTPTKIPYAASLHILHCHTIHGTAAATTTAATTATNFHIHRRTFWLLGQYE